ncbi:hypothetical protein B0H14DRAFT_3469499 [Mycena olivaceomarginata]|nr:hypothetical protein B0H14DRAFT_3469499 [Mycena olivaceomarginata]
MLWTPTQRTTRSGTVFAAWSSPVPFFAPLLFQAVAAEREGQEDCEPEDSEAWPPPDPRNDVDQHWTPEPLNQVDEEWPLPDPSNDIDDVPATTSRKRRASPTFDEVVAAGPAQSGAHRRHALKRAKAIETSGHGARDATMRKYVEPAQLVSLAAFTRHAKVEARDEKRGSKQRRTLAELMGLGFQLIPWNGLPSSTARDTSSWSSWDSLETPDTPACINRAYDFIKEQGTASHFPAEFCKHRRGLFAAINVGLTFGKGQKLPTWIDNKTYTSLAERLLNHKDIARMAHFASVWAPRLHRYYIDYNTRLNLRHPGLRRPFAKSVFSCAAFNFSGNVWTFKHRDVCNLPFGLCAVQSLGNFDPPLGGHLVLWDLKLVVEFPAGALILLPSATVAIPNIPVQGRWTNASPSRSSQPAGSFVTQITAFARRLSWQQRTPRI